MFKQLLAIASAAIMGASAASAQTATAVDRPLDVQSLEAALGAQPQGTDAERLAERIRVMFGGRDALLRGAAPKTDETTVAWALELPEPAAANAPAPRVAHDVGNLSTPMVRVGSTNVYALVRTLTSGSAFTWHFEAGGRRFGGSQLEVWETHPDSRVHAGVPKGAVKQMPQWESRIFPGTKRDWWIYVPAQYRPDTPAAVMVFQDGNGPRTWVPTVFDNLIARHDMPVTVAIFIEPGGVKAPRDNRSFEYDTLSDQYARFLLEEILPEVEKTVKLRHDAASRAIAGQSSGAICAFTVAWERPNEFSKVVSWTGSFTNIAAGSDGRSGGHNYEALVRRLPKKPIRVFLQDGSNDLDVAPGSWWLANQTLARSLEFAGYDVAHEWAPAFTTTCTRAPFFRTRCGGCGATIRATLSAIDGQLGLSTLDSFRRGSHACLLRRNRSSRPRSDRG
jgi:enterochelin esterase family protein